MKAEKLRFILKHSLISVSSHKLKEALMELDEIERLSEIGKIHDKRKKDLKALGTCIRDARKEAGMIQDDIAFYLDVNVRTISNWENGHNMPNESFRWKIERVLGVQLDWGE